MNSPVVTDTMAVVLRLEHRRLPQRVRIVFMETHHVPVRSVSPDLDGVPTSKLYHYMDTKTEPKKHCLIGR